VTPVPFQTAAEVAAAIPRVVAHLRSSGLLAYPTETVYGLGSRAQQADVAALAALKGRTSGKPFLLLISDREMAEGHGLAFNASADALARAFWPGPLTLVLPALVACAAPDADFVLLVKPQFEVGKGRVGSGGVVREAADRADAVRKVAGAGGELSLGVLGVTASPLPGPAGNVEYFLWLRRGAPPLDDSQLERAIKEGPS